MADEAKTSSENIDNETKPEIPVESPADEIESVSDDEAGNDNADCSRFSDDGMETEIEVSPEEVEEKKEKKKKRANEERSNQENKAEPDTTSEKDPPEEKSKADEVKVDDDAERANSPTHEEEKKEKKQGRLAKLKSLRTTPLQFLLACKVCVLLPIAIYALDVLISVNVLEDYSNDLLANVKNNRQEIAYWPFDYLQYNHGYRGSVLKKVEQIAKQVSSKNYDGSIKTLNSRNVRQAPLEVTKSPIEKVPDFPTTHGLLGADVSSPISLTDQTSLSGTSGSTVDNSSTTKAESSLLTTASPVVETSSPGTEKDNANVASTPPTTVDYDGNVSRSTATTPGGKVLPLRNKGKFCHNNLYFVSIHKEWDEKYKLDWYNSKFSNLRQYQQTLFFMYTVGGFIFLMTSIVMRCDIFLNEKWSSYLLLPFLLYCISTSLTAHVFYAQSSSDGIRCFLCQFVSYCHDINPWDFLGYYFPTGFNWSLVSILSYAFKLYDCFVIGIVTLRFVLDEDSNPVLNVLKILGWMIVFPLMIFTPLLGVFAFEVFPGMNLASTSYTLGFTIVFGIGCGFWALFLIVLPIFCKLRMCNGDDEEEAESEDEMY